MKERRQNPTLSQAASQFLACLSPDERKSAQQEIYRFTRWYGLERSVASLKAHEVANYAERLSLSDTDYVRKLEIIRDFLVVAQKEGWSPTNLATHLKIKRIKPKPPSPGKQDVPQSISLTQERYEELQAELSLLKDKRSQAIDEIRKAAADKDFRENAPLEAAREQHGQIVGRINELEEAIKAAIVINDKQVTTPKVTIGDNVVLQDMASGEEIRYMIVSSREVDPSHGKISNASPVGKAILGRSVGEVLRVITPSGNLQYKIKLIERNHSAKP